MAFIKLTHYRFSLWIAVFSLLLVAIPLSIMVFNELALAKFFGILLVILLLIALRFWFAVSRNRNNIIPVVVLNKNDMFDLMRDFRSFDKLSASVKDILINRIGILLSKVKLVNDQHELLERRKAIQLAYMYLCEHWSVDFKVETDWIFVFSDSSKELQNPYNYRLSSNYFKENKNTAIPTESL